MASLREFAFNLTLNFMASEVLGEYVFMRHLRDLLLSKLLEFFRVFVTYTLDLTHTTITTTKSLTRALKNIHIGGTVDACTFFHLNLNCEFT